MTFPDLYRSFKNLVYNLALQYVQNTEDAEEITQDVFVKIYDKLDSFKGNSDIKTWIYRITINQSLDFIRTKNRRKKWGVFINLYQEPGNTEKHFSHLNHPGVALEQKEELEFIFNCINRLPENQKNAIILLKIEQLSIQETAIVLNISDKAVESLFQRAKKNLENLLKSSEGK